MSSRPASEITHPSSAVCTIVRGRRGMDGQDVIALYRYEALPRDLLPLIANGPCAAIPLLEWEMSASQTQGFEMTGAGCPRTDPNETHNLSLHAGGSAVQLET